jgi:ABC-type nitrate/sulfonate/bicarbonate transport system permease component
MKKQNSLLSSAGEGVNAMKKLDRKQGFILLAAAFAIFNILFFVSGLWRAYFLIGVLIDFVFLVMMAEDGSKLVNIKRKKGFERFLAIGFPVLVLLLWELTVRIGILNPRWFPPPTTIVGALWDLITGYDKFTKTSLFGRPWLLPGMIAESGWEGVKVLAKESHLLATLYRVFIGFILGSLPGVVVGVVMGVSRSVRIMLDGIMSAIYVLPKITIYPIMMLVFADPFGEGPKVAVVAISVFFLVAINAMAGVAGVDFVYLEAGKNYGANRFQMFKHVILPGALPVIFAGLRLALGTALIVIVAVEFVRAKTGVGYLTFYYWEIMAPDKMYAGLIIVMALGWLLTAGLQWIEKRMMPWQRSQTSEL